MSESKKDAQTLISDLLKRADEDTEFKAWKASHPEKDTEFEAMTREEKIDHIIDLLGQLGLVEAEETTEPTAEAQDEAGIEFEDLTEQEQKDFTLHCLYVDGFYTGVSEAIETGSQNEGVELILNAVNAKKQSPLGGMAISYCVGLAKGIQIAEALINGSTDPEPVTD